MTDNKNKRTFEAQPAINTRVRLEPSSSALALDKVTPRQYSRMSAKQREELVIRLIDFLKSF
jgi:hypothetical protein